MVLGEAIGKSGLEGACPPTLPEGFLEQPDVLLVTFPFDLKNYFVREVVPVRLTYNRGNTKESLSTVRLLVK